MDSRLKQWMGSSTGRFLLVVAVPIVLYQLGRWGNVVAPGDPIVFSPWAADIGGHVLLGLLTLIIAFAGIVFGALALWVIACLAWDTITWVRTGNGGKRGNG